ncbi:hypothetical protein [Planosporangium flavigriseum]|nr:hypothetical protein [Planosporangium flavigriseum]
MGSSPQRSAPAGLPLLPLVAPTLAATVCSLLALSDDETAA